MALVTPIVLPDASIVERAAVWLTKELEPVVSVEFPKATRHGDVAEGVAPEASSRFMVSAPADALSAIEQFSNPNGSGQVPVVVMAKPLQVADVTVPVPDGAPPSTILPLASNAATWAFVSAPDVVANDVVLPEREPTVGTTPAPPPITGALAVSAPDDASVPDAVYARTPPLVPDVSAVPPCATGSGDVIP